MGHYILTKRTVPLLADAKHYNLKEDPNEIHNRVNDRASSEHVQFLNERLFAHMIKRNVELGHL